MGDYRSYRTVPLHRRQAGGPQRIADVLTEVLARYAAVEPEAVDAGQRIAPADLAVPTRQLELFEELSIGSTA